MGKIRRNPGPKTDGLETYRAKRSADRTTEPFGARAARGRAGPLKFVVQQHAARRMHWDLRLEIAGVLRSWAVPKGPSLDPDDKRLAVLTEDHPLDYLDYEGVIPRGNYGAGAMIVWDRGTWVPIEPVESGLANGKLLFDLHGYKLRGRWTLVRTKEAGGRHWLLMKKPDGAATGATVEQLDAASILSGLTVEELAAGVSKADDLRRHLDAAGLPPHVEPWGGPPMLAESVDAPFTRDGWLFELKYDGYRLVALRRGPALRLLYRSGKDATAAFPDVAQVIRSLPYEDFAIDGEVVILDPDGRPNFQRLQRRGLLSQARDVQAAMAEHPATFYAFDVPFLQGHDLRGQPLVARKEILRRVVPGAGPVRYSDHIMERGEDLFREVISRGLEGIVAKRAQSPYVQRRSSDWLKIRVDHSNDFVIVGFSRPKGSRSGFGALHLAIFRHGVLHYAGRVGTGFDERMLQDLHERMLPLQRDTPPCAGPVPTGANHVWIDPQLVCEVRFREVTDDGLLRHPVFLRLRDDKAPDECREHEDEPLHGDNELAAPERASSTDTTFAEPLSVNSSASSASPALRTTKPTVTISNPDKPFWPEDGYTKLDLVEYYRTVGPWLLPYLRDRPLVLTRYPDGIHGKSFFQKNAPPYVPEWLKTTTIWSEHGGREIDYFICDSIEAITYIANMAAIPLHVWASRIQSLQFPDWCVLDLDPKGAPFRDVVTIALAIRDLCEAIDLPCFAKTSGSTGLHVLLPLGGKCTHEQSRMLGQIIAGVIVEQLPDIATVARTMSRRHGRVYVDCLQNGHGRLLVSPLSVRPLPGATVSMPLQWSEVVPDLHPAAFTIETVPLSLARGFADPLLSVLDTAVDIQAVLARLARRLD